MYYISLRNKGLHSIFVWVICILGLTNNYFVLLISNMIVLFLNVLKAILCLILYVIVFSFLNLLLAKKKILYYYIKT